MWSKFKTWKRHHQAILGLLLGAAVIAFWRGIWGLLDVFLFPGNSIVSYAVSMVAGAGVIWAAHYIIEG